MIPAILETPKTFSQSLFRTRRSVSRDAFLHWQQKKIRQWIRNSALKTPYYQGFEPDLSQFPIVDKSIQNADFASFNRHGISISDITQAIGQGKFPRGLTFGTSSGTSGNKSYFVVSDAERFRWLGTILAKTLVDMILQKLRIAIVLPQSGPLYDSASKASRIKLRHFNTHEPSTIWTQELREFSPEVIVAAPKVLRFLAQKMEMPALKRVFSASETLDPLDRKIIESSLGIRLDQIYMATEGLFATTCRHGEMHLCEDSIYFEFEEVGAGLVSPIISSFQRETQIMARYQMNDLLRLGQGQCSCGSPLQLVKEVIGRKDDLFAFKTGETEQIVTPDILRMGLMSGCPNLSDFRIVLAAFDRLEVHLPQNQLCFGQAAKDALGHVFALRGIPMMVQIKTLEMADISGPKLRRIENKTHAV